MFDETKGIYPPGHYIIGEDIEIGRYILSSQEKASGCFSLYESYNEYKNGGNSIIDEFVEKEFYINLKNKGNYMIAIDADIKRIK